MLIYQFIISAVLLTLLPGPDILLVMTQSALRGVKVGVVFAAGLVSGIVIHTSIVAFGLGSIITNSPVIFNTIKIAGAIYLIYIGVKSFLHRKQSTLNAPKTGEQPQQNNLKYYLRGFTMNVLNPKVIIFFLALFPQFIIAQANDTLATTAPKFFILGAIFIVQAFCIFSTVAFFAGKLSKLIIGNKKFAYILSIVESALFIGIGASLLLF